MLGLRFLQVTLTVRQDSSRAACGIFCVTAAKKQTTEYSDASANEDNSFRNHIR